MKKYNLNQKKDEHGHVSKYEDRTTHFFSLAPRLPRMPGLVSGDSGFIDDSEDSFQKLSNSFSIVGIFPIGKVNIQNFSVPTSLLGAEATYQLADASIHNVALSKDLCRLIVICSGDLVEVGNDLREIQVARQTACGLHCLALNTSIFWNRKNELHQIAQQASSIEHLIEVVQASLSAMCKQWSDAMHTFQEKFASLSSLIIDHGLDSSP